jgi:hypothetical protein
MSIVLPQRMGVGFCLVVLTLMVATVFIAAKLAAGAESLCL